MHTHRSAIRGLSTGELLVVIAVLTVLAFLLMKLIIGESIADQRSVTISRLIAVSDALDKYAIDNGGRFPTTEQGLDALLARPTTGPHPRNWLGPYMPEGSALRDAWGRPFHYVQPGAGDPPRSYDLWSLGADGAEGGSGPDVDIVSWDRATLIP